MSSTAPAAVPPIVMIILAIFLPPVAVFLKKGIVPHFWINVVMLLIFPVASVHALWIVLTQ